MPVQRATPIDQLYGEVADHDLVVVPDAPLASALNRRLERPHLGPFAITPRRLAARQRESAEDRRAFLAVIEATDLGWKRAAAAVGDVLQCWEHEARPDAILDYEGFDTPAIRTVVDCVRNLETTSTRLTRYEIDTDRYPSVAVVAPDQLTALERSILPPESEYDAIDRFLEEPFELPPFRIFDSPSAVVDAVLESITADAADDVAVVLDAGSDYSPLLESALESAGIPFYGGPGFADDRDHRSFLDLLRTVFAGSDTRVGDVRPVLTHLGASVPVDHDEKRLAEVDDPALDCIRTFQAESPRGALADALERYEGWIGRDLDRLREELDLLGLLDEPLTESVVDRLAFYLRSYEVPIGRENEGVLLADATSAAFVDRPVVFRLGLDDGWTHSPPRRPWVDDDEAFDRQLWQFRSLLQSGVEGHSLVVDAAGGRPVAPTIYFEELLDEPFERFSDLDAIEHTRPFGASAGDRAGFDREPIPGVPDGATDPDPIETISQSSLNSFVNSPRDYLFGRLVDGPDRDYFVEGNLFHDFAEFFVAHPDAIADETGHDAADETDDETADALADETGDGADSGLLDEELLEDCVDAMLAESRSFHREIDLDVRRTRYRAGLRTIATFLDDHGPDPDDDALDFLTPASGWGTNFFAERFDRRVDSPLTERWFEDADLGLKGKIDLVAAPDRLLDFKSGARKRASQVTRRSALDPPGDPPNYQALCYLTYWRRQRPGERLEFTFFHFLECLDDVVTGELTDEATGDGGVALEDCLTTISYRPIAYDEFVTTAEVFEGLCQDASNDCNKTFSQVDHGTFLAVLDDHSIPTTRDGDELAESAFGEALTETMVEAVGDYKYVHNGCVQACRHLAGLRKHTYFEDDLDAFERFVDERIEELNAYRQGGARFPVAGPGGEPNYRYVDHRDMLLEGEAAAGVADVSGGDGGDGGESETAAGVSGGDGTETARGSGSHGGSNR